MTLNIFFKEKFNYDINNLDLDLNSDKKYIFYNELNEQYGYRYDYIIKNNLDLNNYDTHSPSCINLYEIFNTLNITSNDSFMDIGCGKGFTLIISSLFNFNKICGIEISKKDYQICKDNLEKLNINKNINLINDDVLNFEYFSNYNYFYFYSPFGSIIFEKIIIKIICTNKHFYILYKNIHQEEIDILLKYHLCLVEKYNGKDRDYYLYKYDYNLIESSQSLNFFAGTPI